MKGLSRIIPAFAFLMIPIAVCAQQASFAGKYEGTAKEADGDGHVSLNLTDDGGKFSGTVTSPRGTYTVVKGQIAANVLTLDVAGTMNNDGVTGTMTLRQKEDKLVGELSILGRSTPVELRKVAPDEISGEWDAVADAQGEAFPFTLTLKLDGEKVAGSSSSQLGTSQVSTGIWKDGRLSLVLDSATGPIGLLATLTDGKLVGDYDYAGQLQGKWVAVKKK